MSFTVLEIKEQAIRVRAYWRARRAFLSAEGATLLSMVEAVPPDAVFVSHAELRKAVALLIATENHQVNHERAVAVLTLMLAAESA